MSDFLSRVNEILAEQGVAQENIKSLESSIRYEFAGQLVYIHKRETDIDKKILDHMKRNYDIAEAAKKFKVSKTTVYRILARRGNK